jgi:hypothetical protein
MTFIIQTPDYERILRRCQVKSRLSALATLNGVKYDALSKIPPAMDGATANAVLAQIPAAARLSRRLAGI